MPLVSVILPVRDAARTLRRCLASLAAQTLGNHEVVAIDDGSADDSGAILASWAAGDPRLRVVRSAPRGLVAALNTAAGLARADVVARMDADDVCAPDRLALQWQRLREGPIVHVLGARVAVRREDGAVTTGMRDYVAWQNTLLAHEDIVNDLWVESPLVHPSVMMPADTLRALGGYRELDGPEDYDLWLRAEKAGLRFAKHEAVLLEWWDSEDRLTRSSARYTAARFFELKVDTLVARHLSPSRPVVIWGTGPIGKQWSRALRPRGHEVRAFVEVDPRKIGSRIHGVPVLGVGEAAQGGAALHLAAVGQPGRRQAIRAVAAGMGLVNGRDMIAVA